MQRAPSTPEAQLAWLVDRAAISDLVVEFARCLDAFDFEAQAALFTEDGVFHLPYATILAKDLAGTARRHVGRYDVLQHVVTNIGISVDGGAATVRFYFLAVHEPKEDKPAEHADVGGWFDAILRRVDGYWRIATLRETALWQSGRHFPWEEH